MTKAKLLNRVPLIMQWLFCSLSGCTIRSSKFDEILIENRRAYAIISELCVNINKLISLNINNICSFRGASRFASEKVHRHEAFRIHYINLKMRICGRVNTLIHSYLMYSDNVVIVIWIHKYVGCGRKRTAVLHIMSTGHV